MTEKQTKLMIVLDKRSEKKDGTFAVNGDVGAAKLYFNVMGCLNGGQASQNMLIQNQQNNIQINNTVLSQETVKHLNSEQLNEIEEILKTASPINTNNGSAKKRL